MYDDVFEAFEQSQPGTLRPEAKLGLMRMDSGAVDSFGDDVTTPLTPPAPMRAPTGPYTGLWDGRPLSTITEETHIFNPEKDNILLHMTPRSSLEDKGQYYLYKSSFDKETGTLATAV